VEAVGAIVDHRNADAGNVEFIAAGHRRWGGG
jgi:hypothetical protein